MAAASSAQAVPQDDEVDFINEKDLYKILGVSRGAKQDAIKKAYRKLSLRHHPDKNPDDPDAKLKFQKIAEAFSVLSDDKKRLKYDKSGDVDLEDIDIEEFMNMWVGEMMMDGGMVDDMMQEVLPWSDEEDKMEQFMQERIERTGKSYRCRLCSQTLSSKALMLAHFNKSHSWECEDWARDTIKSMKASFESFMKQLAGVGDSSGSFILPDGTKADMSNVKGVPDIRAHMERKLEKSKHVDKVMDMYRRASTIGSTWLPAMEDVISGLEVDEEEAKLLMNGDRNIFLDRMLDKLAQLQDEEDQAESVKEFLETLEGIDLDMKGFAGLPRISSLGGGQGGLGGMGIGKFTGVADLRSRAAEMDVDLSSLAGLDSLQRFEDIIDDHAKLEAMFLGLTNHGSAPPGSLGGVPADTTRSNPARGPTPILPQKRSEDDVFALKSLRPGGRVRVVAGRDFEGKFRSGMEGTVLDNNRDECTMEVQFDERDDPIRVAYRHLEGSTCKDKFKTPPGRLDLGAPGMQTNPAEVLAGLRGGQRVKVIAGRNFEKFRGGMTGVIVLNSDENRNMLVQFDDYMKAGPDPIQVAYRHLEPY
mmetsp:Transcript_10066/g.22616  ORF Transcript_10066/g.22616 Transcript_10066/m.22616 type:complete len:588 (+) Transcript_10066:86-1849(+)